MNTAALKAFAPAVRRQLMEAVTRKLDFVLAAQTPDYLATFAPQVRSLRELATADRNGLIERVAYIWFNRLTALRYLDARGWHPFRAKVLTAASAGETLPEILKLTRNGELPADLRSHTDLARLDSLLDGHLPSSDPQGEVYRHLVLAACRFYHALMPTLFERLDDETELLLPDDLLTEQSVVQGFRIEITDDDCSEVEVIGWLYQFYISEKKDAVMARKSAVPSEDIPAVTQLFTPHWIVRYLVENSLGRLWMLNRPESLLREKMPYFVESELETDFLTITKPADIRLIDPAVGSGHMLTYAFDLLFAIYEEEGYAPADIPGLILKNNLYGLDIDPRAAQLASLALTLKAREKSRQFFQAEHLVEPRILALENICFEEDELREYIRAAGFGELFNEPILKLLHQFERATTFGSLIQPCLDAQQISSVRGAVEAKEIGRHLFLQKTHAKVLRLLEQAEALTQRYQLVVANPPYMGSGAMNVDLRAFLLKYLIAGKADLYGAFILRDLALTVPGGMVAMITIPNWLFLQSFEEIRAHILETSHLTSLIHNGRGIWGGDFGSCAFTIVHSHKPQREGVFRRLFRKAGEIQSNEQIESNYWNKDEYPIYLGCSSDFEKMPGKLFGFWLTSRVKSLLAGPYVSELGETKRGLQPGDVPKFVRGWWEVAVGNMEIDSRSRVEAIASKKRWFKFDSGGPFRKWFGNNLSIVHWEANGAQIKNGHNPIVPSEHLYFQPGFVWSKVTIAAPSFRLHDGGVINGDASPCFFPTKFNTGILGLFNSVCGRHFVSALSPTLNFQVSDILKIPRCPLSSKMSEVTDAAVALARADWDNLEISWNFSILPMLVPENCGNTLKAAWHGWEMKCTAAIGRMRELETENNRIFIEAFALQDELTPEVSEDQITLARADARKDMAAFLSYAVGCMMGRYSLDKPGLILADPGDSFGHYLDKVGKPLDELAFVPDADGILPILDGEWFENDIVDQTRKFLKARFGEATLRENVRFIEDSLGKELQRYFLADFYKDHLQTYKKRPIYWLVQSPLKSFSVLIYLHRYTRDTMNVILNKYLREFQVKLRRRIAHLAGAQTSESISIRDKTAARKEADKLLKALHDCEEWERETVLPLAQARIELDLDDGVKANYLKLGEALAPIPGLAAAEE